MSAWVLPALCAIGVVHVAFMLAIGAARYQRAGRVRHSGTEVL